MKKLMIALAMIFLPLTANAYYWFPANPQMNITPLQTTAVVYNPYVYPIFCQGRVDAQTYYGPVIFGYMNTWVQPGQYAYVYVYTNYGNPFINAWGQIFCGY